MEGTYRGVKFLVSCAIPRDEFLLVREIFRTRDKILRHMVEEPRSSRVKRFVETNVYRAQFLSDDSAFRGE